MKVWVLGAKGMLGRALTQRLEAAGTAFVASGRDVDLRDEGALRAGFELHRPDLVLNCAAFTRVDDAEREEAEARAVNALGVGVLGRLAAERELPVLHVSTDYVFPGEGSRPYVETDATGPLNAYGRTKLEGEQRLLDSGAACWIVRTSWLFGDQGPSFPATMLARMRTHEELRVVDDQRGRPTYAPDLAEACMALAGIGAAAAPPGLYHFANAEPVSWYEFTLELLGAARSRALPVVTTQVVPVRSEDFPRPARRPGWSVLDTSKLAQALGQEPRSHRAALDAYLDATLGVPGTHANA